MEERGFGTLRRVLRKREDTEGELLSMSCGGRMWARVRGYCGLYRESCIRSLRPPPGLPTERGFALDERDCVSLSCDRKMVARQRNAV